MISRKLVWAVVLFASARLLAASDYAIVVSSATKSDEGWAKVVAALCKKHEGATVLTYGASVTNTLADLRAQFPRFTCFVATPDEAGKEFVRDVHQLTRKFDDDPYTDTRWGILTGYDASNALRIAELSAPLTIRRTLSGTPLALDRCDEGVWYSELEAGRIQRKEHGQIKQLSETGAVDSTSALVAGLNDYNADLFITSGHATERDWQIGYRYRGGQFRCANGQIYGLDLKKEKHSVTSQHARVYLPVGNCLMGHVNGKDCMAIAFMNSAGVSQMAGYTVTTWFGYAGWGMLDYFVEQPGRYTMEGAFLANQHALIHKLASADGQDKRGLEYDRDVLAFYGDPAWEAKMASGPLNWDQRLGRDGNTYTFEIIPRYGEKTFEPVNTNGSQRGGRPIVEFLSHRVKDVKIVEGADLNPVIADDFILVPLPSTYDPQKRYKVVFQALEI